MPPKKDFTQCKNCGRSNNDENPELPGFKVIATKSGSMRISCPCGIMTRLCPSKQHLQCVWNSKPGKPVELPTIEVKHPRTQYVDPKLIKQNEEPDAF